MRQLFVAILAVLLFAIPAMAISTDDVSNSPAPTYNPPVPGQTFDWTRTVLFDNGPLFNSPGTGPGGADESVLEDASLGMGTYGFGQQLTLGYLMSDDFVVPAGQVWDVASFVFFGYQTGSPTSPSTFTAVHLEIFDGDPSAGGTLIFGDLTTNVLATSVWSNVYRTIESAPHATNRPIMANTATAVVTLNPGHYWVATHASGSLASGPWMPPISILGTCITGDALQYTTAWAYAVDTVSGCGQGIPFLVNGEMGGTPTQNTTWGKIKGLFR